MTPSLTKRSGIYHFSAQLSGRRLRGSLGTKDANIARRRVSQLDLAIQDGPRSPLWPPLRLVLPPATTKSLSRLLLGPAPTISLREIEKSYVDNLERQVSLGRMAQSTLKTYEGRVKLFFDWLEDQKVQLMDSVTPKLLEDYQLHRAVEIAARPQTTNGRSILMDVSAIKSLLKFCVEEKLTAEIKFPDLPQPKGEVQGAEPFTAEELQKMEAAVWGQSKLAFLLFRWTGMRRSDLAMLRWKDIDLTAKTVKALTQKRQTSVTIPLAPSLYEELKSWNEQLRPLPDDKVLTGFTRDSLYNMVVSLGKRCGILEAYPHRFRSTFVVHLLEKGVPIFEVAKMIGDSPATLGQAYAKFTDKMVDNVRKVFEEGR